MEWQIFALVQMFVITVGVTTAFWLRSRTLHQQNQALRDHLDQQAAAEPAVAHPAPEQWVAERLASLPDDMSAAGWYESVLKDALDPDPDFAARLAELVADSGLANAADGSADPADIEARDARIAELEADLEALRNDDTGDAPSPEQTRELKTLLAQFTRDSREMMACIQELEAENASLRDHLGMETTDFTQPPPQTAKPDPQNSDSSEHAA